MEVEGLESGRRVRSKWLEVVVVVTTGARFTVGEVLEGDCFLPDVQCGRFRRCARQVSENGRIEKGGLEEIGTGGDVLSVTTRSDWKLRWVCEGLRAATESQRAFPVAKKCPSGRPLIRQPNERKALIKVGLC